VSLRWPPTTPRGPDRCPAPWLARIIHAR